ncbi:S-layer homology domain-containing protein [Paenibacillus sp. WQ 127069]|uniref:S-layer homology domain-containing protein n=1 Tax=Paenibacillus baimaensis TaxID=2982185 RepID=A0ABT2U815_9BACL|nr:S-layer homology domain-containing protein [Paenibacillus sp. WQ 127069]MCU6790768.1 S-layer homology domain-containing protein [Paenibacillus sp. WQ 127069]
MKQLGKFLLCWILILGGFPLFPGNVVHADGTVVPQIAAGYYHSVGLISDGTVWSWGRGDIGQLGNGETVSRAVPRKATISGGVKSITGGVRSSFAVLNDESVVAWGSNSNGQLGDGTTTDRTIPVQVTGLSHIKAVSGGVAYHTLALDGDGQVWAWGKNDNGELGDGTTSQRTSPVQVNGINHVTAIAAGGYFSLALKDDGTVWAWGLNDNGQLGIGSTAQQISPIQVPGLSHVTAVAAGGNHSLALDADGNIWAWGQNSYGAVGDGTRTNRTIPVQIAGLSNMTTIAGGGFHSLAITNDGSVWTWGYNNYGQLGDGTTTQRNSPVKVSGLSKIKAIAGGGFHSYAMKSDGTVWSWGFNGSGELGDNTSTTRLSPVQNKAVMDATAPTLSSGVISASSLTSTSAALNWTKAADNMSEQNALQYMVYRSVSSNIQTVSDMERKGTALGTYTEDIGRLDVTGLQPGTTYYFNIIVKDLVGYKSAYMMQTVTTNSTYTVTYSANGGTGGNVPTDSKAYAQGVTVAVYGNTGNLSRPGYTFAGWNTRADGSGTGYVADATFGMGTSNVTLYAQWTAIPINTYTVTYSANGGTGGSVPTDSKAYEQGVTVTVYGNTGNLSRPGYIFAGWNTQADGRGMGYVANATFGMGTSNVILYAMWTEAADTTAPTVINYAPNNHAVGVRVDASFVLAFSENVTAVAGRNIMIKKVLDNSLVETIAATDTSRVNVSGDTVTVHPAANLSFNTTYYVQIDEGAFKDLTGNRFAGVDDAAAWSFTTEVGPDTTTPSSDATLIGLNIYAGTNQIAVSPVLTRGTTEYTASLTNNMSSVTVAAAVYESHASVTANVYDNANALVLDKVSLTSGQASDPLPMSVGSNRIELVVTAQDSTTKKYTVTVFRASSSVGGSPGDSSDGGSSGDSSDSSSSTPSDGMEQSMQETQTGLGVTVSGQLQDRMAKFSITKEKGQTVMTVKVDSDKLKAQLDKEGEQPVVVISVTQIVDKVAAVLTGDLVKALEKKQALLEVQTPNGNYKLPAMEIQIDQLSKQLGEQVSLADIEIHLDIARSDNDKVRLINNTANQGRFTVVVPPIDFMVTALYNGKSIEVGTFSSYVEREIPLPDSVSAREISTAVVLEADGTLRHVPTRVGARDGNRVAVISSLTNSTYSLIWHPMTFTDLEGHWAKEAVNNLASSLIVSGIDGIHYRPDAAISRAEFAAIIIRALGLPENGKITAFTDLLSTDWYVGAVTKAHEYGIIEGYADGTFGPTKTITREEALTMIARAMRIVGLEDSVSAAETETILSRFADNAAIGEWSKRAVAAAVKGQLVTGSETGLMPKNEMTRAETAAIIQRMLETANLIDSKFTQ